MATIGSYTNRKLHGIIRQHSGQSFSENFTLDISGYLPGPLNIEEGKTLTIANNVTIVVLPEPTVPNKGV